MDVFNQLVQQAKLAVIGTSIVLAFMVLSITYDSNMLHLTFHCELADEEIATIKTNMAGFISDGWKVGDFKRDPDLEDMKDQFVYTMVLYQEQVAVDPQA